MRPFDRGTTYRRARRCGVLSLVLVATAALSGCGTRLNDDAFAGQESVVTTIPVANANANATGSDAAPSAAVAPAPVHVGAAHGGVGPPTAAPAVTSAAAVASSAAAHLKKPGAAAAKPVKAVTRSQGDSAPAVGAGAGPAVVPASLSPIAIGNIGDYTGVLGSVYVGAREGLRAWVGWINDRGGLNGHPLKLVVGDDAGDPATGVTLAQRMIENEHILAFVGNVIVFEYDQIEAVAKKAGVPIIGGDGASPGWFESTVTFPVASPAPTQIAKGLRYLIDGGADKLGIEYCLEVSSVCKYLNDAVMETPEGKNVVQNDQVSLVAPSYTSQCIRLKQKGVSGVVLLMDSAGASRFAENCATQGYTPKYSILSLDATSDLPKAAILDGAIVPGATFPPTAQGVPAIADFRAGMLQYAPGIGYSGLASASWAAAQVMLKASKFLDKVNPQRSQLFEGLWTVKNDTFGGLTVPLTFNKNAPATKSTCVFIWGLKDGAFTAPREAKVVC